MAAAVTVNEICLLIIYMKLPLFNFSRTCCSLDARLIFDKHLNLVDHVNDTDGWVGILGITKLSFFLF